MQSLSLIKDLEEEVEFSLFLPLAQMDHCVLGLTGTKEIFPVLLTGPLQSGSSQSSFLHFLHSVLFM